jgi:competence protein ComEC
LSVLGPPEDKLLLKGVNDRSLVLKLQHGDVSFLFPGDIEAAGEEHLSPGGVTVMKAPHHGSSTSSSPGLLAQTHPRFVVFCVGNHNRFHFPHAPVVQRYEAMGTQCYRTDLNGAVRFLSDGRGVRVETFGS